MEHILLKAKILDSRCLALLPIQVVAVTLIQEELQDNLLLPYKITVRQEGSTIEYEGLRAIALKQFSQEELQDQNKEYVLLISSRLCLKDCTFILVQNQQLGEERCTLNKHDSIQDLTQIQTPAVQNNTNFLENVTWKQSTTDQICYNAGFERSGNNHLSYLNNDVIELQQIYSGNLSEVYLGFDSKRCQQVIVKKFFNQKNYQTEFEVQEDILQADLEHLFIELLYAVPSKTQLVFEKGECDLGQFAYIRRDRGDPLGWNEIFYIIDHVACCMRELQKAGIYLCDTKEDNILIRFSDEKNGYVPVLSDLGGIYTNQSSQRNSYPCAYTENYFNMEKMGDGDSEPDQDFMVQCELYTLCKMLQKLIACSIQNDYLQQKLERMFKENYSIDRVIKKLRKYEVTHIYYRCFSEILSSVIESEQYTCFDDFIENLQQQWQYICEREQQNQANCLRRTQNSLAKQQLSDAIENESLQYLSLEELKSQAYVYYGYELWNQYTANISCLLKRMQNQKQLDEEGKYKAQITMAYCQKCLADCEMIQGNRKQALFHAQQSLLIAEKIKPRGTGDELLIAEIKVVSGRMYLKNQNFTQALLILQNVFFLKQNSYCEGQADPICSYPKLGAVRWQMKGRDVSAIAMYVKELLKIYRHYKLNQAQQISIHFNLGIALYQQNNLSNSLKSYFLALQLKKTYFENHQFEQITQTNGELQQSKKQFNLKLQFLNNFMCIDQYQQCKTHLSQSAEVNLVRIMLALNTITDQALASHLQAVKNLEEIKNKNQSVSGELTQSQPQLQPEKEIEKQLDQK